MADVKISALPAVASFGGADVFPLVASGVTSKITGTNLFAATNTALALKAPLASPSFTGSVVFTGADNFPVTIIGSAGGGLKLGAYNTTIGAIWSKAVTPTTGNYCLQADSSSTVLNAPTSGNIYFQINDATKIRMHTSGGLALGSVATTDPGAGGIICSTHIFSGQSLTGSQATSLIDATATWNTSGTPTLLKYNVTDTSSNAASLFLDFQIASSKKFSVGKADMALYNTYTSATSFERLDLVWASNVCKLWTEKGSGGGTARDLVLGADATELLRFQTGSKVGFFGATPVVRQTMGVATAGALYTATEQAMIQAVYDAVRAIGIGT